MLNYIKKLIVNEEGQGLTEYALILGVIAISVIYIIFVGIGGKITDLFTRVNTDLESMPF